METIKPKKPLKLAEQLHEQLLEWIMSGKYKEGDKIPSEKELCESFSVSRPVVREAIEKLQTEELVETKKGKGTFVLRSSLANLKQYATAQDIAAIFNTHEVRLALESEAAALAALRRTPAQLLSIQDALHKMQNDFNESNLSVLSDFEFHIGIARATNNETFVTLLENLHFGLKNIMSITQSFTLENVRNQTQPDRIQRVLEEHQSILNAIKVQDQQAARIAMRYHISKVKQRLINLQSSYNGNGEAVFEQEDL